MWLTWETRAGKGRCMESSSDLVARVRNGDDDAFRMIFDRYARPVAGFLQNLIGKHDVAEELTQETFVRAYRNFNSLRDEARLSTWLFGIAKNIAREAFRAKRWTDVSLESDESPTASLRDGRPSPDAALLDQELSEVICKALARLDRDKRMVFSLKVFQECSYEEIVEITGFSLAKVKTDIHRAKAEMRRHMRPYLGADL
jgi:RNA polymerase sigma-70 factor (ECF subfamily)